MLASPVLAFEVLGLGASIPTAPMAPDRDRSVAKSLAPGTRRLGEFEFCSSGRYEPSKIHEAVALTSFL